MDRCKFCFKQYTSPSVKCKHQKICKKNPQLTVSNNITNINQNITNNISNTNNITNNMMINGFGREDVSYLTGNIATDIRINTIRKTLTDTMDLVHFNADHPENQTVRKLNKKSDLMEFKTPDNTWESEPDKTGLKKMQQNLEQKFQTKFDDEDDFNRSALSEILYQKSQRGGIPEDDILSKYDVNDPKGRQYIEEKCAAQVRKAREAYFRENDVTERTAATGTVWMQRDLRQIENEVRGKYALPLRPEIMCAHTRSFEITLFIVTRTYTVDTCFELELVWTSTLNRTSDCT